MAPADRLNLGALARWAILAALIYFACLRFIYPGYLHPLSPHHNDFYFPVGLSYDGHTIGEKLLWPRPLGFLALQLIGKLGLHGYLAFLVGIAILNAALVISLIGRIMGRPVSWIAAVLYCALVFAHPDFYIDYLHDACATLSLFYLLVALHFRRNLAVAASAMVLLAFTKETYFVPALFLWFLLAVPRKTVLAWLAAFTTAFMTNTYSLKRLVGMTFGVNDPYHVSLSPAVVAKGALFYASHLFPPIALLAVAASLAFVFLKDRKHALMAAAFLIAGMCAALTHAALPNHVDSMYAWTGATLAFGAVLFLPLSARDWKALVLAGTAIAAYGYTNQARYQAHQWTLDQEKINRKIIATYPALKHVAAPANILVTGLSMPYQPFYTSSYIRAEFGPNLHWTVTVPVSTEIKPDEVVTLVRPDTFNLGVYDYAFGFAADGTLRGQWTRAQLQTETRDRVLYPELSPSQTDWLALLRAGQTYLLWGDLHRAAETLQQAGDVEGHRNPYPAFFLGQVHEKQGKIAEAMQDYGQAIALDSKPPNPAFQEALTRLQRK